MSSFISFLQFQLFLLIHHGRLPSCVKSHCLYFLCLWYQFAQKNLASDFFEAKRRACSLLTKSHQETHDLILEPLKSLLGRNHSHWYGYSRLLGKNQSIAFDRIVSIMQLFCHVRIRQEPVPVAPTL